MWCSLRFSDYRFWHSACVIIRGMGNKNAPKREKKKPKKAKAAKLDFSQNAFRI